MTPGDADTIAAVATPPGIGGIAVVRVSGIEALGVASEIFHRSSGRQVDVGSLPSHTVHHGQVVNPVDGTPADEVLMLVMKAPRSYTGEDVVEFDCHGGPVPVEAVVHAVLHAGARMAGPGEFTKRAFLNGKMDLSQAEAVADVISARSRAGARLALQQLEGQLGRRIRDLRGDLLDLMAHLEVVLDYPEMDIEEADRSEARRELAGMRQEMEELILSARRARPYREGVRTVIVGRPNVGKSSLLNGLLQRDRAIVTDTPGTTRDVLEETVVVQGIPLVLVDTAGLREGRDRVEEMGVERARRAAGEAELMLLVFDDGEPLNADDMEVIETAVGAQKRGEIGIVAVLNKIDLAARSVDEDEISARLGENAEIIRTSALTREGLDGLEDAVARQVACAAGGSVDEENAIAASARHEQALRSAATALDDARSALASGVPVDLVGIDLRECARELGTITGESAAEGLLDRIFSQFCVGK